VDSLDVILSRALFYSSLQVKNEYRDGSTTVTVTRLAMLTVPGYTIILGPGSALKVNHLVTCNKTTGNHVSRCPSTRNKTNEWC